MRDAISLNGLLLKNAADNRHGVTFEVQMAIKSQSDLKDLYHAGVPSSVLAPWESASGGVSRDKNLSELAAIGESVERYSAATAQLPTYSLEELSGMQVIEFAKWPLFTKSQRNNNAFPFSAIYKKPTQFVKVRSFHDNSYAYVPQPLVVLRDDFETGLPTSSGLAASTNPKQALLQALLELIERDALMVTWLNSLSGHRIDLPKRLSDEVTHLSGKCFAFDLTPAYSPFPVIAVAGHIPKDGKPRFSLGVACKTTLSDAVEKAYNEWHQGVFFAGIFSEYSNTDHLDKPTDANTFDDHAVYYSLYPDQWDDLPLFSDQKVKLPRYSYPTKRPSTQTALKRLKRTFIENNIRTYYIDLSGIESVQSGTRVMRALSPDLAMIFAHQAWPLIDRVDKFRKSRYPKSDSNLAFPNPMPHPLG